MAEMGPGLRREGGKLRPGLSQSVRRLLAARMNVLRELKRRAHFILGPVIGVALTGYFSYNLIEGEHGLIRWLSLTREIRAEKGNLELVRVQRQTLDMRVSNLKPDHVDPDLLDEQVRAILNLVAPDEIVIMQPATPHQH